MTDTFSQDLLEYAEIKYMDPETAIFSLTPGGFLSVNTEDDSYSHVNLHRAFPFTRDSEYISVRDQYGKEIGIIKSISDFPKETIIMLEGDIKRRYFSPKIESIIAIKEELGFTYWEVMTNAGPCRFTAKVSSSLVTQLSGNRLLISDVDGSRFEVSDYKSLDEKSLKSLQVYL